MSDDVSIGLDEAEGLLNRALKERGALSRMREVIALARKYENIEKDFESKRASLEEEIKRLDAVVVDAAAAVEVKRAALQARLDTFDAELRERRDRVERDFQAQQTRIAERLASAERAVKAAETDAERRIKAVADASAYAEAEHAKAVKERATELVQLDDRIKAARREMEALRNQLGGR